MRALFPALALALCGCTADNPDSSGDLAGADLAGAGGDMAGAGGDMAGAGSDMATGCGPGMKMCGGQCTDADPAHGCASGSCTACGGGANGTPACAAGACALQCNVGFGDCDGNLSNGCEKDVTADAMNCGSCGFACQGGAPCVSGACQLVMPGTGSDQACLTIDASSVYWATANASPGAVYSVPKAGGNPTVITSGQQNPRGIAVDQTSVYFTTLVGGKVFKCPLAGCNGNPTTLAANQTVPFSLAVDATNAYWTNAGGGTVMKCALGGCNMAPTPLAGGQARPTEIATDGKNVYWTNQGDGTVMMVPIGGGNPTQLAATGMPGAHGVAVDSSYVYFTQSTLGLVARVAIAGGNPKPVAMGQMSPWGIAVDAASGYVFWSNSHAANMGGAILKAPAGGGMAVTRAQNQQWPLCVAVDATTIYWIDAGGNSVQKVAK